MKNQDRNEGQGGNEEIKDRTKEGARCFPEGMPRMMAKCWESMGAGDPENMTAMMGKCCVRMRRVCLWFPLIPVVLAGASFLLGYYLPPDAVRVLWLFVSGTFALAAVLGLILANAMCRA